jgi:protein arginine N-methyltransferase 7
MAAFVRGAAMSDTLFARFPATATDARSLAKLCELLRQRGQHGDALIAGEAALAAAPGDTAISTLVHMSLSHGVPSWHGPMLRDEPRNRAYAAAIKRLVKPGMLVLEIGSGAGLLSMMAARAGAQVITCELNPVVEATARAIVERNGLSDRITIIGERSSDLRVGVDLPRRADLLMSELFDDTLFGDHIMQHVGDALDRLLVPDARVIPCGSSVQCQLVAFQDDLDPGPVAMVEGFDMSLVNLLAPPTSDSQRVKPPQSERRSDVQSALTMDFDSEGSFGGEKQTISFISRGGRIDGMAQWLRIDFGDGIFYENDPFGEAWSHWGSPYHPFHEPLETKKGDRVDVTLELVQNVLTVRHGR